jgi:hypothetical protein
MIKIDRLETHDRLQHFTSQNFSISECCQDLINQRPFGNQPFYIFAHARTDTDNISIKRLIWQPRLSRPKPQTNSMLFKAYPGTDIVKIIWMLPARELWDTFKKGQMTENADIRESIDTFENNRQVLEKPEDDDLSDMEIDAIYQQMAIEAKRKQRMDSIWMPSPVGL